MFIFDSSGWYCLGGAIQPMPTDAAQGGKCLKGQYCPIGSEEPIPCPPGKYCHRERLDSPTADCTQGKNK